MQLTTIIRETIREKGPLSFRDFMEMALYYPDLGYYTSANDKTGIRGDFYTSPGLTPAFGAMIARQIEEMGRHLGQKNFTIVEMGAGMGQLCQSVLGYLEDHHPDLYAQLNYGIIEKSPAMRQRAQTILPEEKITWYNAIEEIGDITGCVLSNELVDNFAVHRVVMQDQLMEIFVDCDDTGFVEILQPAAPELKDYLAELGVTLPKGYCTEINREATEWLRAIAGVLTEGYVLTIDYGHTSDALYSDRRSSGTLVCYHRHHLSESPYERVGEQDMTAHVNFSALQHWGSKHGLLSCGLTTQADFLLALGWHDYLGSMPVHHEKNRLEMVREQALLTRTLLIDMGHKFNVLIQRKGDIPAWLTGLKNT